MKLFQRVIEQRLRSHFENIGFLNKHQSGFRRAKSTDDHLFRLSQSIMESLGTWPSSLIQIYKQCVRPIFDYGSLSTITSSDYIISKIQRLQNKFIRLALCLPKYICPKLLHDSSGLPYVKDRLLSCASKSLDRIAQNPLVEQAICSNRQNPARDRFPTPLSAVRPVSL